MSKPLHDSISRTKAPSIPGKSIFVGIRATDVFWQYNFLHRGWAVSLIEKLGGRVVSFPLQVLSKPQQPSLFQLQPYYGLVTLLSLGSSVKQIAHMTLVSEQEISPASGLAIAAFDTILNFINTLLSVWTLASPVARFESGRSSVNWTEGLVTIGAAAYVIGILTEAVSEFQRKAFKQDPANKDKPYGGGLFSLATNINYGGYTIWRAGYALVCGGAAWGTATFGLFFYDFASRGVPVLDHYLTERYCDAYKKIRERVGYSLIPGIY